MKTFFQGVIQGSAFGSGYGIGLKIGSGRAARISTPGCKRVSGYFSFLSRPRLTPNLRAQSPSDTISFSGIRTESV